jgi:ElaB/YqjD/DUF883 family membrane-anchored ribosome-binding protein
MGERNDAERSLRAARERLNAVALELSRRATGDYVKARARDVARQKTEELKARASQQARERTDVMKGRILDSPWALGFIGGVVGTVAGTLIGKKTKESRMGDSTWRGSFERPYDEYTATHRMAAPAGYVSSYGNHGSSADPSYSYGYGDYPQGSYAQGSYEQGGYVQGGGDDGGGDDGGGLKERIAGGAQDLRHRVEGRSGEVTERIRDGAHGLRGAAEEKAGHLMHDARERLGEVRSRAGHAMHSARDHIPSRQDLRHSAIAMKHTAADHPGIWALAAVAAGAVIGSMMPVSDRERQALQPVKARAREKLEGLQAQARERVESVTSEVKERIGLEDEPAGSNGSLHESADTGGATYHASSEGGEFGPSYSADVDRSGSEGGYGGGSVGISAPREGEESGYGASTGVGYGASPDDEARPFTAISDEDSGATRH